MQSSTPTSSELPPGTAIAERFVIEQQAGRGGMGSIFRARDMRESRTVALKLMHPTANTELVRRFVREAELLAELRHPGIVTHVAHGITEDQQPFLVMEWLDGEDLSQRLARGPLSPPETLFLLRRTAEALTAAHQRGIIHRDLKPSNLFLREGRVEDVVVLDFGLARRMLASQAMTGAATILGTPAYMAPEQASCQQDLTPSADIFSLGCVLYECLTGQQPFRAPHLVAVLAKVLFAEPPPMHELRGELPRSLQVLVDRMLLKEPKQRLRDAMALKEALAGLELLPDTGETPRTERDGELAGSEQRLVSVLLVHPPAVRVPEQPHQNQLLAQEPTVTSPRASLLEHLHATFSHHGAQVMLLADGSLLITLMPERGTATDQVALAARCALSIKERWPEAVVVLSTGRGILGQQRPEGEVMDRAGELLRRLEQQPPASSANVPLDEVTARLLGPGFQVDCSTPGTFLLQGEHLDADASRLLLGQPTPCVGREQELSMLELTLGSCVEEEAARAVLVMAPAGVGKSRLRHEFLRRLEKQGRELLILLGRGDAMRASAYGLLGQAVRRLCGIQAAEALEVAREKLQRRAGRHLPLAEARTHVEFLGELCGIPFPAQDSPSLHAARMDPRVMSAQVARAFVSFLRAESAHAPVLLVLEDLHWGDARTVQLVDEALRTLTECPLMVLALARPEVKELFPHLWSQHLQELSLRGLSRKAGARLVREVLGQEVSESVIERVVEQAAGNALFLEELIRMLAEGRGERAPATVLAMLQGRIQRLEAGERRVLLAASIFGRTVWAGGIQALLRQEDMGQVLEQRLRRLVDLEILEQQPESRFPSEVEYRFRHVLVRDAAYALLSDGLGSTGHRQAGMWLEQVGETDPLVLAEHYHLGHERERALTLYIRGVERLFEATDDYRQGHESGSAALSELKPGCAVWCMLAGATISNAFQAGREDEDVRLTRLLLHTEPEPDAIPDYVDALLFPLNTRSVRGAWQEAAALLERMVEVGTPVAEQHPPTRARLSHSRGFLGHFFEDTVWRNFTQAEQGVKQLREVGDERPLSTAQLMAGNALAAMGDFSGAEQFLHDALATSHRLGGRRLIHYITPQVALVLAWSPEETHRDEARTLVLELMKAQALHPLVIGRIFTTLAKGALDRGEPREAEAQARRACELMARYLPDKLLARTVLGTSLLAQGRVSEAREASELGFQELEQMGGAGFAAPRSCLLLAEACFADGDTEAGASALRRGLRSLRTRAGDIPDLQRREQLLHRVPENARLLELARQWWGRDEAGQLLAPPPSPPHR
jgi:serine/threonine protein kinase